MSNSTCGKGFNALTGISLRMPFQPVQSHAVISQGFIPLRLLIEGDSEKFSSFDAMDVALAASGTVSTELALASVPSIIAYKVGWITGFIFERLVDVLVPDACHLWKDDEDAADRQATDRGLPHPGRCGQFPEFSAKRQ